ncbi:MAG: hypothetical protein PWQ28_378 [Candidatus Woesearchaeota archaeon]|nr:hypothetical protein [Candidatus Woesearchaeota archaeon]
MIMAFDPKLDKELERREKEFESTKIIVSVQSYNEGAPKVQISRQNRNDNGWIFSKLGRLSKEEAEAVYEMLGEILESLED